MAFGWFGWIRILELTGHPAWLIAWQNFKIQVSHVQCTNCCAKGFTKIDMPNFACRVPWMRVSEK